MQFSAFCVLNLVKERYTLARFLSTAVIFLLSMLISSLIKVLSESFFNTSFPASIMGWKVTNFSEQSSWHVLSVVGAYWNPWIEKADCPVFSLSHLCMKIKKLWKEYRLLQRPVVVLFPYFPPFLNVHVVLNWPENFYSELNRVHCKYFCVFLYFLECLL